MISWTRFPWAILGLPALLALAAPQAIGPDEMQAHTTPYVPAPDVTVRTQVELVEVPVVVRDRQNKPVAGLTANDFTIFDAGKKQQITAFSVETFAPPDTQGPALAATASTPSGAKLADAPKPETALRFVALCLDDLNSDTESLMSAKKAARQFVQTSLAPGDRVAVVTTASPHGTPFTDDVPAMLALIDKVMASPRVSENVAMDCPPIKPYEAYLIVNRLDPSVVQAKLDQYRACAKLPNGTAPQMDLLTALASKIWDRALLNNKDAMHALDGMVDGLSKLPGRRTILLASSGFFAGELDNEINLLIEKAVHAGVVINTLGARGVFTIIPGGDGAEQRSVISRGRQSAPAQTQATNDRTQSQSAMAKDDVLSALANGTGGQFFHDNNDLLKGFRQLGMVPDVLYLLGFAPTEAVPDGRFHSLKVQLRAGDRDTVQAKKGYTPAKPAPLEQSPQARLDAEVKASDTLHDLPARIAWEANQQKGGITYTALIDLSSMTFLPHENRRAQRLILVAVLRDAAGNFVAGKRSDVDLYLTNETFARLVAAGGLRIAITVEAPPGTYTARGVVQDGLQGKMATSSWELRLQ